MKKIRDRIPLEIGDKALWMKVKRQAKTEKRTIKSFVEIALWEKLERVTN